MRRVLMFAFALALLLPAAAPTDAAPAAPGWDYDIVVAADGRSLTVQLCVRGFAPGGLHLLRPDALSAIQIHKHPDGSASYRPSGAPGVVVPVLGRHPCLRYTVDLAALARVGSGTKGFASDNGAMVCAPGLFMLRPRRWPRGALVTAAIQSSSEQTMVTGWPHAQGGQRRLVSPRSLGAAGRAAIGAVRALTVDAAQARFEIAVAPGKRLATDEGIRRWIARAAATVSELFENRFPLSNALIVVWPSRGSHEPVLFGHAIRADVGTVQFYLAGNARDDDLPDEWVAVHEMIHLGMPWTSAEDAWIQEGFVTYYQEVLRGRSGHHTEHEAWQAMHDGFNRGRRAGTGRTLAEESRLMHRTHAYRRVYWGGAALALAADLSIRKASRGTRSLDDVMRYWWKHHLGQRKDGRQLLAEADRMLGLSACEGLGRRFLGAKDFLSLTSEYAALGLGVQGRQVVLLPQGAQVAERTRIMRRGGK